MQLDCEHDEGEIKLFTPYSHTNIYPEARSCFVWPPRTSQNKKIAKIILPINVHNIHWYIAILRLDETGVNLDIQNNIDMRSETTEVKLMEIGKRYYKKMWDQTKQISFITPKKETQTQKHSDKEQVRQDPPCNT